MFREFKRTFQQLALFEVALYAMVAALTSLYLTQFHYAIQFFASTIASITFFFVNKEVENFFYVRNGSMVFLTLSVLSLQFFTGFLAAVFVLGLILVPSVFFSDLRLALVAVLSHVADIFSTHFLLPQGSELNPLANYFIGFSPIFGLPLLKLFFVVLPVVWSVKNMVEEDRIVFLKFVFALGVGMSVRNFVILF